jgi:hypothetical protein
MALAHKAALLAAEAGTEAQVPVDVLLLGVRDLAAAARDRLAVHLRNPADHIRWAVVRDMTTLAEPPRTPEALDLLALALGDNCPQIRLEAIGLLGRRGDGREHLQKAMKRETVPAVKDALAEILASSR